MRNLFKVLNHKGPYSPTILKNVLRHVLQIFLYLEAFETNTTSVWLNHTVNYGLANHKMCYFQIYKILREKDDECF